MKAENFTVNVPEGKDKVEVILRQVNDEVKKELPVLEPERMNIHGTISAPFRYLEKRWNAADMQADHSRTHVIVDRDGLKMTLVVNETDPRNRCVVTGSIQLSRQFRQFGINTDNEWEPGSLGDFFRVNRACFETRDENMRLVSLFKSFKARVQTDIEREVKNNGSFTDNYKAVVDSNLPDSFFVRIPVFKGAAPERIEIEIVATVSGRDVSLRLISSDASSILEEVRDGLIDEQISKIEELAPEIPIIEA